jgi:hypothetical protein
MSLFADIERQLSGPVERLSIGAPSRLSARQQVASPNTIILSLGEVLGLDEGIWLEKLSALFTPTVPPITLTAMLLAVSSALNSVVNLGTPVATIVSGITGLETLIFQPIPLILVRDVQRQCALQGFAFVQPLGLALQIGWTGGNQLNLTFEANWRRISGIQEG